MTAPQSKRWLIVAVLADPTETHVRVVLGVLCVLTVAARLAYATTVDTEEALAGWDGWEYLAYARSIAAGTSDHYVSGLNSIRPPMYPLLLSGVSLLSGATIAVVQVLQSLLGAVQVVLAYRIGRLGATRAGALLSAILIALSPHLVFFSAYILTESVFTVFLWAGVYSFVRSWRVVDAECVRWLALSAALLGLAALTRPTVLALAPVLAGLLLLLPGLAIVRAPRPALLRAVVFCGVFLLIVGPWMARNAVVRGEFTLAPRHGAFILAFGNSPELLKVYEARSVDEYYRWQDALTSKFAVDGGIPKENWLEEPRRFILYDTSEWLRLEWHKAVHFWTPWVNPMLYPRTVVIVSALYSIPVFVLGAIGLVRLLGARSRLGLGYTLLVVVGVGFLTGGLIFHTQVRYRVPFVDTALAIAAGAAVGRLRPREDSDERHGDDR